MELRVLQVLPELESGGVERGVIEVSSYLAEHNIGSYVASSGGKLASQLKELGVNHVRLPLKTKNPFHILWNSLRLKHYIEKHKINIVHGRSRAPAWSAYLACLMTGARFVTTFHGSYDTSQPLKRFYNSVMLKGQIVIAVSNYIKKHIETRYHHKTDNVKVIHRCADLDFFDPKTVTPERVAKLKEELNLPSYDNLILLPNRISRHKGHIPFVNALNLIKKHKYTALIVGHCSENHSEYRLEIQKTIEDFGLENRVFLRDKVSDMPALYSMASVVVCPSVVPEPFGRIIAECFAMKVPVVATACGAHNELIAHEETGFLCKPSDSFSMSEQILKALNLTKQQRDTITSAAYKEVTSKYTLEKMCSSTLKVYQKLFKDYEEEFGEY